MNYGCSALAKLRNNPLQLQLQDCGMTAGNKPSCSKTLESVGGLSPHLLLAVLFGRPSLLWLGPQCVLKGQCVRACVGLSDIDAQNILHLCLTRTYVF